MKVIVKGTELNATEKRVMDSDDIRKLCIENEWYTCGSNEDYSDLLNFIDNLENVTTQNIFEVAINIYEHSDLDEWFDNNEDIIDEIKHIMFLIERNCCHTFFTLK